MPRLNELVVAAKASDAEEVFVNRERGRIELAPSDPNEIDAVRTSLSGEVDTSGDDVEVLQTTGNGMYHFPALVVIHWPTATGTR